MTDDAALDELSMTGLLELLDRVAERLDTLGTPDGADGADRIASEQGGAQEDRTIHRSRARLARTEAVQARAAVGEIRRQARELASQSALTRRDSRELWDLLHTAGTRVGPVPDTGVLAAARAAGAARRSAAWETDRAQRLAEQARHLTSSVCWAQLAAPGAAGLVAWAAGDLDAEAVGALEDGPRAEVLAGGGLVVLDEQQLPGPAAAHGVRGILALPLTQGDSRGVLVLAAATPGAFDGPVCFLAERLARTAAPVVLGREPAQDHLPARAVIEGAQALLGRHLGIEHDETFETLLEIARTTDEPVLDSAARLVAAFVPRAPQTEDAPDREPAALRRAVSYVERHAAEDIGVDDIACAAGIGARGVQQLFRRHRDCTPLEYLRQVRLDRARAELQAAGPASGATVGTVAARWGFTHPGRFSVSYRERFGEPPSTTLRT